MKLIEFLKEDYLDLSKYGSLINTNTRKVYTVGLEAHGGFIQENPELFGFAKDDPRWNRKSKNYFLAGTNYDKLFHKIFWEGWVRVTHDMDPYGLEIHIEGFPQYVKKAWPLIRPSTKHADKVIVDIISQRGIRTTLTRGTREFELPHDRGRMIRFFTEAELTVRDWQRKADRIRRKLRRTDNPKEREPLIHDLQKVEDDFKRWYQRIRQPIKEVTAYEYGAWIDTTFNKVYKTDRDNEGETGR